MEFMMWHKTLWRKNMHLSCVGQLLFLDRWCGWQKGRFCSNHKIIVKQQQLSTLTICLSKSQQHSIFMADDFRSLAILHYVIFTSFLHSEMGPIHKHQKCSIIWVLSSSMQFVQWVWCILMEKIFLFMVFHNQYLWEIGEYGNPVGMTVEIKCLQRYHVLLAVSVWVMKWMVLTHIGSVESSVIW